MPLIRTLLMLAARRAAADPALRQKASEAAEATRDKVLPAARNAARNAGETARRVSAEVKQDVERAVDEAPAQANRAEIAGRVARRLLDRARGGD